MNFNLISDTENGYDFQTRFREDIHIKKNSRAYLNFALLSKLNAVNLTQDQEIRVISNDLFPKFHNNLTPAQISQVVTIPKGIYTTTEIQKIIQDALKKVANESPELYYYSTNFENNDPTTQKNVQFGYFLEDNSQWQVVDFVPDLVNSVNFNFDPNLGLIKTSATLNPIAYDCFSLSSTHYYHHFYPSTTQPLNNNLIYLDSNVNINDLEGNISFGLVSTEFKALNDTDTVKYVGGNTFHPSMLVGATNTTPSYLKIIKSFISVDVTADRTAGELNGRYYLTVYQPRVSADATSDTLKDFNFSTQFQNRTDYLVRYNLNQKYTTFDQPVRIIFQTYIPTTNGTYKTNERRVYYRIFLTTNANGIFDYQDDLIFDSAGSDSYFSYDFFNTFNVPTNTNQAGSMIPFKIFLSSQVQNQGWSSCKYLEFNKATDTASNSRSIMNSYTIELSAQLADYLEKNTLTSRIVGPLYPNCAETELNNPAFFYSSQLSLDFLNDSYSIIIEELPLKSYKNTETQANGGYSQHILANIPCPFTNNFNNVTKDTNLISTVFTPSFQSYIEMKNQDFKTNHLRVKIMNMRTNYPALELKQSTINFTIEETEESK